MGFYKEKKKCLEIEPIRLKKRVIDIMLYVNQAEELGDKKEAEKNLKLSQKCYKNKKENLQKVEQYKGQSF
ncbi:hypothetical protein [Brachyspira hampsonii]|uniref:Uncharacterized protein n=2 Tax=Brachyspira hampsonii TaxID=1287055 RepID=A0A2U4F0P8_9SPIR|nr:hypothetical protein [Brachyspira hampsonii]EKV57782.1 hypothetical protein A966_03540 [Brachyspira hampsonii 30446]MBW5388931.1 hypothetical protein [Brachyspira hampsonii]MBW5394913.1 hypothetical protein [Brachyspira hampsonii]OEJ20574.1 hypothetical protein A9495_01460 [Brachyspira hampsonii]